MAKAKSEFIFCLLFIVMIFGCVKPNREVAYYPNGTVKSELLRKGKYADYIEYYESGKVKSRGRLNGDLRVGSWLYFDTDGSKRATGVYESGLKKGEWRYDVGGHETVITWGIFRSDSNLVLNYPQTWILKEHPADYVPIAAYSDSINWAASFNVTLLEVGNSSINDVIEGTVKKNKEYADVLVLSQEEIEINGKTGKVITQQMKVTGSDLLVKQYFIRDTRKLYLVSFFVRADEWENYKVLVNEIAYSLRGW